MSKSKVNKMNKEELEKMAISELLREVEEPKTNKTANKQFLGRTLNSVLTHNKRENERLQRNCRSKLKALEDRRRQRLLKKDSAATTTNNSVSSTDVLSSSDSDIQFVKMTQNKRAKQTKQKCKSKSKSSVTEKGEEAQRLQYAKEEYYAQHFNELAAYALASESYNQVGKWLCYQALLAGTYDPYEMPYDFSDPMQNVSVSKENTISISSDDEIQQELDLDTELCLEPWQNSEQEVPSDTETMPADALELTLKESQLIDEELAIIEPDVQTIELSDEETNIPQKKAVNNDSIDLTTD